MDTIDLVRQWKQPGARQGGTVDHPAGEISLGRPGGLARRAGLLAGHSALRNSHQFPTMTFTLSIPQES
ncbi:hypothetical protein GCM10009760_08610 [Kitasatospora kazusensis]|uniref:Uncharacterized protein n=1 Tax=Kitasatospora kazusensis TaxID=407974 RepID=A0ABP5KNP3_9ACTN